MEENQALNRLRHLRLRHLELLDLVVEEGSLSAVAQRLCLTQPAVTSMLRELETAVGTPLVDRGRHGAALTDKGRLLLERFRHARHVLEGVEPLLDSAPALDHVRIGAVQQSMLWLIPRAYALLRSRGLPLRLDVQELTVPECIRGVLDGRLDCAITRVDASYLQAEEFASLELAPLARVPLRVVCHPEDAMAGAARVDLAALARAEWVIHPRGSQVRAAFEQAFLHAGLTPPRPMVESLSFYSNFHLIVANRLVTLAPETAVRRYADMGMIHALDFPWPVGLSPLTFVCTRQGARQAVGRLRDACLEVVRGMGAGVRKADGQLD